MKRRAFLKESAFFASGLAVSPWLSRKNHKESFMEKGSEILSSPTENLEVVVLTGTPKQRGQIHGETLRKKISEVIKLWKGDLQKSYEMNPDTYIEGFVESTHFANAIKKWTPDLLDEVKGISEGSGIDYKTIFAFQLPDEEWWYGRNKKYGISLPEMKHCSALGVFNQKGLPSLLAQNMDMGSFSEGFEVLLHIKHQNSPLQSFVFTFAGLIALTGINNQAVGVCCNTLLQLNQSPEGLPVAFIVRGILEQSKYHEATKFIHGIKHASGQNYTIGGPEEVAAFECSANKVSQFIPYPGATRVYHTNHPLLNDDQSTYKEILKKLPPSEKGKSPDNSEIRFNALEKRLKDPSKRITVETIKSTLSSHDDPQNPVCRHRPSDGGGNFTAGCLIMELGESPVLNLAPGPPCSTEFKKYHF